MPKRSTRADWVALLLHNKKVLLPDSASILTFSVCSLHVSHRLEETHSGIADHSSVSVSYSRRK